MGDNGRSAPGVRVLFRGVFLIALATLLYEIVLTRVLSFTIWYHFAYVVISTALLGFGVSGTLLAVRPSIGRRDLASALTRCSVAAALSAGAFVVFVSLVPLHPMELLSDPSQALVLLLYQLGATVPFFFSGLVVSLSLREAAERVDRLYFWDLTGGALGCILAVPLMNLLTPPGTAFTAAAAFAGAALAFTPSRRGRIVAVGTIVIMLFAAVGLELGFTPARSKHYSRHVAVHGMEPVFSHWTALFRTDVVKDVGKGVPIDRRGEFGLSRLAPEEIQLPWGFISHDATAGTQIFDPSEGLLDFVDQHVLRAPYVIASSDPKVLIIGVGGGRDVITAIRLGASKVTGLELDPVTVDLIRDGLDEATHGFYRRPEIELIAGEGRHFVKRTDEKVDLIQITGVDTLSAEFSGAYVLAENYLYTVEAFHDYLGLLEPGGVLSIAVGHMNHDNPRSAGRMVSVAQQALRERGVEHPERHIAVIHSRYLFAEVLISPDGFTKAQLAALQQFSDELDFRPLLMPGGESHPVFLALATAQGEEREALLDSLEFLVHAATDDSPFFFKAYRWGALLDFDGVEISPVHQTALGPLVLAFLLVSLTTLGAIFVTGPLIVFSRRGVIESGAKAAGILSYFLAIGLGFMLFEISLMQQFVLYLGYPTYSLSVTLCSLLVFLGWGSFLSRRFVGRERIALPAAVACIGVLALFYMKGMPPIQDATLGAPLVVRIGITVVLLAPLGLVLGVFFPLGIRRAAAIHEDLVPWAWGINGCASVTGTVVTVVLAMSMGFQNVWILSLALYAGGVAAMLATMGDERGDPA